MSNILTDETFAGMLARSAAYQSAFDLGVLIGRRELKPLIGVLVETIEVLLASLKHLNDIDSPASAEILARAKEALENDQG